MAEKSAFSLFSPSVLHSLHRQVHQVTPVLTVRIEKFKLRMIDQFAFPDINSAESECMFTINTVRADMLFSFIFAHLKERMSNMDETLFSKTLC